MPKSVTVSPYDYAVEAMDLELAKELDLYGDVDYTQCVIRVDTTGGYRRTAATLDHEIAHAVCHGRGATARIAERVLLWSIIPADDRADEKDFLKKLEDLIIEQVVEGMHAVRRDNPDVVKWIDKGLVKG